METIIKFFEKSTKINPSNWQRVSFKEEAFEIMLEKAEMAGLNMSLFDEAFDSYDGDDGRVFRISSRFKSFNKFLSFFSE